ncbi:MAG TPA: hypothetical protein VFE27_06385 [Acidobacteriaceae bacterium]|nr:hypothetical protein [Acidobacteriaceae bacterium]
MNIFASCLEFVAVPDTVISESALPNGEFQTQPMREAAFDESNDSLD